MLLNDTKGKNFGRAFNESEMFQFQSEILFFYLTAFLSFSCLLKIFDRLKKLNTSEYFTLFFCGITACIKEPCLDKL